MYMNVYDLSPINRKFTGLHRFYRKVSSLPRTLGDASSNDVPVGHRHLQGQHDPKEAWHLRQPINGNKTGEQPLLKKFPAKKQLLLQQITYLYIYIFIAFYLEGFTWEFSIVSGELWDLNLVTYGNCFFNDDVKMQPFTQQVKPWRLQRYPAGPKRSLEVTNPWYGRRQPSTLHHLNTTSPCGWLRCLFTGNFEG